MALYAKEVVMVVVALVVESIDGGVLRHATSPLAISHLLFLLFYFLASSLLFLFFLSSYSPLFSPLSCSKRRKKKSALVGQERRDDALFNRPLWSKCISTSKRYGVVVVGFAELSHCQTSHGVVSRHRPLRESGLAASRLSPWQRSIAESL